MIKIIKSDVYSPIDTYIKEVTVTGRFNSNPLLSSHEVPFILKPLRNIILRNITPIARRRSVRNNWKEHMFNSRVQRKECAEGNWAPNIFTSFPCMTINCMNQALAQGTTMDLACRQRLHQVTHDRSALKKKKIELRGERHS
jgi:hypothetical protein